MPTPSDVRTRSAITRCAPWSFVACSRVVSRKTSDEDTATVSTSGVTADEKRRDDVRMLDSARNPPTRPPGRRPRAPARPRAGRRAGRGAPRRSPIVIDAPAATPEAVSGSCVAPASVARATAPTAATTPATQRTTPIVRGSDADCASACVGRIRAARRAGGDHRGLRGEHARDDRDQGGDQAQPDLHVLGRDAVAGEGVAERAGQRGAGQDARQRSGQRRPAGPPSRPCAVPGAGWRRRRAAARSRARAAAIASPIVLLTTNIAISSARPPNVPPIAITASRASMTSRCSTSPRAAPVTTRATCDGGLQPIAQRVACPLRARGARRWRRLGPAWRPVAPRRRMSRTARPGARRSPAYGRCRRRSSSAPGRWRTGGRGRPRAGRRAARGRRRRRGRGPSPGHGRPAPRTA